MDLPAHQLTMTVQMTRFEAARLRKELRRDTEERYRASQPEP
jgi:hypothetical protein